MIWSTRQTFRPRPHVWQQQRKVTPWAGTPMRRWDWRRGGLRRDELQAIARRAQLQRWAAYGAAPCGDRASMVTSVASARDRHFRLVDAHGKATGPRYHNLAGRIRPLPRYDSYLCEDAHGRQVWLRGDTRVRLVSRQKEDLMSQASRLLKAAHRRSLT